MSLRLAGAQLSRPPHAGSGPVRPASASMHESCLYHGAQIKTCPELKSLNSSLQALEKDAINQNKKYGGMEPTSNAARFNVKLPTSPQHEKYSRRALNKVPEEGPRGLETNWNDEQRSSLQVDNRLRTQFPGGVRFNKRTLRMMFKEIDRDSSGVITQRELIISLRQHKSLLAMFTLIQGADLPLDDTDKQGQREEVYRIKEILKEVDTDGSGTMEWAEFVEFFRRAGLLLEYKTRKTLNRTTLCQADFNAAEISRIVDDAYSKRHTMKRPVVTSGI